MTDEKPLHVRVAEALSWTNLRQRQTLQQVWIGGEWVTPVRSSGWEGNASGSEHFASVPYYDTDWSATGPLIEWLGIDVGTLAPGLIDKWWAYRYQQGGGRLERFGATPLLAVCHLLLALAEAGKLSRG